MGLDQVETITLDQQQYLLSFPAVFVNKAFVTRRQHSSVIRLSLGEVQGDNVVVRGTYVMTMNDLIEFKRLLTRTIDDLATVPDVPPDA